MVCMHRQHFKLYCMDRVCLKVFNLFLDWAFVGVGVEKFATTKQKRDCINVFLCLKVTCQIEKRNFLFERITQSWKNLTLMPGSWLVLEPLTRPNCVRPKRKWTWDVCKIIYSVMKNDENNFRTKKKCDLKKQNALSCGKSPDKAGNKRKMCF